jgi:hypothetical protein
VEPLRRDVCKLCKYIYFFVFQTLYSSLKCLVDILFLWTVKYFYVRTPWNFSYTLNLRINSGTFSCFTGKKVAQRHDSERSLVHTSVEERHEPPGE